MFGLNNIGHLDHQNGAEETGVSRFSTGIRMAALGVLLTVFAGACDKADISTVSALKAQLNNMKAKVAALEGDHAPEALTARTGEASARAKGIAEEVCASQIAAARVELASEATKAIADAIAREKLPCGVLDKTSTEVAVHDAIEKVFGADSKEVVLKSLINDVLVLFVDVVSNDEGFENAVLQEPKIKVTLLALLKANPDKLDDYVSKMIAVITALPEAKRVDVAKGFAKFSLEVMKAMALYSKFAGVVDHHDKYVYEVGYGAMDDANQAKSDTKELHVEYEGLPQLTMATLRMLNDLKKNGVGFAKVLEVISSAVRALVQ